MCGGTRAPHAHAAYAKAAEIRSEPCSLTVLRLNLQLSPGETPSFLCWRPERLAGLPFCGATNHGRGAPWGPQGKHKPSLRFVILQVCWRLLLVQVPGSILPAVGSGASSGKGPPLSCLAGKRLAPPTAPSAPRSAPTEAFVL